MCKIRCSQKQNKLFYALYPQELCINFVQQNQVNICVLMEAWLEILLLVIQLSLFLLGRICDDLSWYTFPIANEQNVFEGIGIAAFSISLIIKIIRKWQIQEIIKIMFLKSQIKFIIPWALNILIIILFFNIFGCKTEQPDTEQNSLFILYDGCCLNAVQILLTNLNYSMICNTKAHLAELVIYEMVLFAEIIFNGNLLLSFVNELKERQKDYCILFVSIMIANQILIMDLLLRAAYEEKEREREEELKIGKKEKNQTESPIKGRAVESFNPISSSMEIVSPMKQK